MVVEEYINFAFLNGSPNTEMRRNKTHAMKRGVYGRFMPSIKTLVPTKQRKSAGKRENKEGFMIFPEAVLFYPLYCGNIADSEAVEDNSHDVDTWFEGTTAQRQNTMNRVDFKNHLSVFGTEDKFTKSAADCVRTLVTESGLLKLGYPIYKEGDKLMKVVGDKVMGLTYEDDRDNKKKQTNCVEVNLEN